MSLDEQYWHERYLRSETGWDVGQCTTPLRTYFDGLRNMGLRILIPGAGRGYEAEYLHRAGFTNVHVLDLTDAPFADLLLRCPSFPRAHLLHGDLFAHDAAYDLIVEQTFFCALDPALRPAYVERMHHLLVPGGKLRGVLFDQVPGPGGPPFGGSVAEYEPLFRAWFTGTTFARCHNSIPPRAGRELWLRATRSTSPHPGRP